MILRRTLLMYVVSHYWLLHIYMVAYYMPLLLAIAHSLKSTLIYTYSIVIYMWLYFGCNLWLFKVVAFVSLGTQSTVA